MTRYRARVEQAIVMEEALSQAPSHDVGLEEKTIGHIGLYKKKKGCLDKSDFVLAFGC